MEALRYRRRQRSHRLVFISLIGLLVGFSLWSLWLLARAEGLRDDLDLYFGWLDEIHAVHAELDRLRDSGSTADGGQTAGPARVDLEEFRRSTDELLLHSEDPGVHVAVQKLRLALDRLPRTGEGATGGDGADALWQASVAALSAVDRLEDEIKQHVGLLHQRLGSHWRSLWLLVVGTLILAASNLTLVVVIHRRRLELESAHSQVLRSSRHDPLTGLWNREGILRLLSHELVRATRSKAPLGLILVDLEDFKTINELVGHDQGDYILEQIGQRLESLVRPYDTTGRLEGDSFLVVLPACDSTATDRVARRLRESLDRRDIEHAFGRIQLSINLAQTTVEHAGDTDIDTLLHELQEGIDVSKTGIPRPSLSERSI